MEPRKKPRRSIEDFFTAHVQLESKKVQADVDIAQTQANVDIAQTQANVDIAQTQANVDIAQAQAQVQIAQAQVQIAQAQAQIAKEQTRQLEIVTPFQERVAQAQIAGAMATQARTPSPTNDLPRTDTDQKLLESLRIATELHIGNTPTEQKLYTDLMKAFDTCGDTIGRHMNYRSLIDDIKNVVPKLQEWAGVTSQQERNKLVHILHDACCMIEQDRTNPLGKYPNNTSTEEKLKSAVEEAKKVVNVEIQTETIIADVIGLGPDTRELDLGEVRRDFLPKLRQFEALTRLDRPNARKFLNRLFGAFQESFISNDDPEKRMTQIRQMNRPGNFNCFLCSLKLQQRTIKAHVQEKHPEALGCIRLVHFDGTAQYFWNSTSADHITNKTLRLFECKECNLAFPSQSDLKTHNTRHDRSTRVKCTWEGCKEDFISKNAMEAHVATEHQNKSRFMHNGKAFASAANLQKHLDAINGNKKFPCPNQCGYSCVQKGKLASHLKTCGKVSERRKKHEEAMKAHLLAQGYAEHKGDSFFPAVKVFRREVTVRHSDGSRSRLDFIVRINGIIYLIEVDEDQHRECPAKVYTVEKEQKRMLAVSDALTVAHPGEKIVWVRFNPDGFKVDRKTQRTDKLKRYALFDKYILHNDLGNMVPSIPVEINGQQYTQTIGLVYMFYDMDANGKTLLTKAEDFMLPHHLIELKIDEI